MARGRPSRATVYTRLDAAIAELRDRLGGLPSSRESGAVWDAIWHLEAHHSTALEGNTLVLREVEALLEQQRPVGRKPLREYLEVQGYGDAARWVYAQALEPTSAPPPLITVQELRRIHHLAMSPVRAVAPHEEASADEAPGSFRRHDIRPFASGMTPPSWPLVDSEVRQWTDAACALADTVDTPPWPERLARVHASFERVHPFLDGNGRTGRLALNLLLVRLGYPPVIVLKQQRQAYLTGLARADAGDDGPLGEIIARAVTDNLNRFVIPSIAGPARVVPLAALVDEDFTLAALRQAAQRGRLEAHQDADGLWRSSRHAVDQYRRARFRRRPGGATS